MTSQAISQTALRRKRRSVLTLPFALLAFLVLAAGTFVSYALWPTWTRNAVSPAAPEVPITVSGVLFEVPPAAIRIAFQRQPGPQERIDLAFQWPSLTPPPADAKEPALPVSQAGDDSAGHAVTRGRLFVTIAGLGKVLPPAARLRGIYPHYVEPEATIGPGGLAILPFRDGTPYAGEDLVYLAGNPEQFFARCTRQASVMPGTCLHERLIQSAEMTLRFPREWLDDWRNVAAGFDRLVAQLHPG
jgi:hypothetical protein